jgi:tetratricopeptide (TPR) repeat protein
MQVAQANLDIAYRESGHYDRRITELRERVRLSPEDRDGRWELAGSYAALGRHARRSPSSSAARWQPHDVPAMLQLGLAEKARASSTRPAPGWRGLPAGSRKRGRALLLRRGAVQSGLNEPPSSRLKEAIARNPDYAEAHYLLAFVYGDIGQHEAAREATKRAIKLNPTLAPGTGQPGARALRRRPGARRRATRPRAAPDRSEAARWPTTISDSPSAEGLHDEALRGVPPRARGRRGPPAQPPGDGRGAPAPARAGRGARAVRRLVREHRR